MTYRQIAERWVVLFLAEVLKTSGRAIKTVLPHQPRWLAQIGVLEAQLRAVGEAQAKPARAQRKPRAEAAPSLERLLAAHAVLRQGVLDLEARGLSLDDDLVQRMRTDWNLESVVRYLQSSDAQLKQSAAQIVREAAAALEPSVGQGRTNPTTAPGRAPGATPPRPRQGGAVSGPGKPARDSGPAA